MILKTKAQNSNYKCILLGAQYKDVVCDNNNTNVEGQRCTGTECILLKQGEAILTPL
jgi:hypothetical protein